jgi:hypothetical protein
MPVFMGPKKMGPRKIPAGDAPARIFVIRSLDAISR